MFHAIELIVLLAAMAIVWGIRIKPWPCWALTAVGLVAFASEVWHSHGGDLRAFWMAGRAIREGASPYDATVHPGIPIPLNPPTAFPLFAAFSLLPYPICFALWTAFNAAACFSLVGLSAEVLRPEAGADAAREGLDPPSLGLLSTCVAMSFASRYGIDLGQLAIAVALLLIGAVWARSRGRWLAAAGCLAFATAKPGTMLPFLLLFLGKGRKAILWWFVMCLALVAMATPPAKVPARLREMAGSIARLDISINNYEYKNTSSVEILGFDHLLYRLGLRDRPLIRAGQAMILMALGAWLTFESVRADRRLPDGALVALVSMYAVLFLYHRFYDAVLLALPLTYLTARVRDETGLRRALLAAAGTALLGVLYLRVGWLRSLMDATAHDVDARARLIQAVFLPYATWSILLAMACLVWASPRATPANG